MKKKKVVLSLLATGVIFGLGGSFFYQSVQLDQKTTLGNSSHSNMEHNVKAKSQYKGLFFYEKGYKGGHALPDSIEKVTVSPSIIPNVEEKSTGTPVVSQSPEATKYPVETVTPSAITSTPSNHSSKNPSSVTSNVQSSVTQSGQLHSGNATYYDGGYTNGCASLDPISRDYDVVAMNVSDYNNAELAGAYLEVTGENGSIHVLVTDLLPEGKKGDLDLNESAFEKIAPKEKGKVEVTWKIVPLPTSQPIRYKFKQGSSQYWCGVQIRNHRYPIAKLEYKNKSGNYVEIQRTNYNYFETSSLGAGPYTFRVTDIYGHVLVDENIPLSVSNEVAGASNFTE